MSRGLYKIKNNNGAPINFGTITVNPSDELVVFNRAKDYTIESGDILREKIEEGVLLMYRFDDTIMTNDEAHESITIFENNFGKLSAAALTLPEIKRNFYTAALIDLENEAKLENVTYQDEELTLHFLIACSQGLLLLAEHELEIMIPNSTWDTNLINKYKEAIAAIKI